MSARDIDRKLRVLLGSTSSSTDKTSQAITAIDGADVPRSIERTLDLLEVVLGQGACKLTEAASATELTPTTALRYLRALETRGYLKRDDDGDFSAGPTIHRLAAALRGETIIERLITTTQPHLDALANKTGESTYLAVSDGKTGTYIATAESPRAIRHVGGVGRDVDLDGSALGEALSNPGKVETRTGAIEADITAMSRALPSADTLGIAISIVGPAHRFTVSHIKRHRASLNKAVDALLHELRVNGEDLFR